MNTREKVYEAIDTERAYQDTRISNKFEQPAGGIMWPVPAEILMMEEYIKRAREEWTNQKGDVPALHMIRKVAGLAVRCMEHHGAFPRI